MKNRTLGKSGPVISEVGLGCWQLGGDWGDPLSEENGLQILKEAVDQGVSLFDTADVYGGGKSESLIGTFLKTEKRPLTVITKFGRGNGVYPDNYSEKALFSAVENSLKRLGVNSLDLLQLHCVPQNILEDGAIFTWLRNLKNQGMIKNFGASIESIEQGLICMQQEDLLSLQVIFNIFRQRIIKELFPKAIETGTGIIVRLPLASGLLSGAYNSNTTFAENDHRNYNRDGEAFNVGETFAGLEFAKGLNFVNTIKTEFLTDEIPMAQFALRWILDHPAVSCVIPGASKVAQVRSNAQASDLPSLNKKLHQSLVDFYQKDIDQHIRGLY
ncbi:aldo/keto reductase [Lutimonas sp.]|uniref:aldo/keto reductase n=1 Tax=Lutimonas sp. TaxID=1872403 RepID=UPI003D9B0878